MIPNVLFVCVENSCRSQLAEAFINIHAQNQVNAYSAGSAPSGKINPKAIASLAHLNYDLKGHNSKSLKDIPDIEFEWAITMGCGDSCPNVRAKNREDWKLPNPADFTEDEFHSVRDLVELRVKGLIKQITKAQHQ